MSESFVFNVNLSFSDSVVLGILKLPYPILHICDCLPVEENMAFIWTFIYIPFTQGWFVLCMTEIGLLILEKNVKDYFQYKHT
jgi:hypothetical protein